MADNRIAYGLAKKYGIDTKGMSPQEVWEALNKKGVKELGGHRDEVYYKSVDELKKEQEIQLPQTLRLPDETLPKSLSARWINQDIKMPDGTVAHFVEGSKLHNIEVFAGKGTKTSIRDVERLVKKYGGQAENWQKVKGIGMIKHNEEEAEAELHWYYEPSQGKQEIKFKRYL